MTDPDRKYDEFTCSDCGASVWSVPPQEPPPSRCATCAHLNEFVADPVEREALRRRLMGVE
jgi:DNA-directed RNA polymerase subunit RPC12/RpoP